MIMRPAVSRHAAPEHGFRSEMRSDELCDDLVVAPLRIGEFLLHERKPANAAAQPSIEISRRQVPFEPNTFLSTAVEQQDCRRPDRTETVKPGGVLLDVRLNGEKVGLDEVGRLLIRVRLCFQPSACASSRRRAEIDQHGATLLLGPSE